MFEIDPTKISKAKSDRIDKQYYVDFSVNKEEAKNSIEIAEDFITEVNNLIETLSEETIEKYHKKAISLFVEEKRDNNSKSSN
mgnify:FL=1